MGIRTAILNDPAVVAAMAANNTNTRGQSREDKEPVEFWLNIGFETDDPQFPFIDLTKSGIALDRVPEHGIRGEANTPYKKFMVMQDALRKGFLDRAAQLAPGETAIVALDESTGLCMQIRRVANQEDQPVVAGEIAGLKFR